MAGVIAQPVRFRTEKGVCFRRQIARFLGPLRDSDSRTGLRNLPPRIGVSRLGWVEC